MMMERKPEANHEPYAAWEAQLDAAVESECAKLRKAEAPAVIAPVDPKPKPAVDPWSTGALAPRARTELRASLRKMDDYEVNLLWAAWKAIKSNHGCDTPAEEFVSSIASYYLRSLNPENNRGLTPDYVADQLETFRDNFRDALAVARHFNARYPAEVKEL